MMSVVAAILLSVLVLVLVLVLMLVLLRRGRCSGRVGLGLGLGLGHEGRQEKGRGEQQERTRGDQETGAQVKEGPCAPLLCCRMLTAAAREPGLLIMSLAASLRCCRR